MLNELKSLPSDVNLKLFKHKPFKISCRILKNEFTSTKRQCACCKRYIVRYTARYTNYDKKVYSIIQILTGHIPNTLIGIFPFKDWGEEISLWGLVWLTKTLCCEGFCEGTAWFKIRNLCPSFQRTVLVFRVQKSTYQSLTENRLGYEIRLKIFRLGIAEIRMATVWMVGYPMWHRNFSTA